jgi:hypothetical protein
MTFTIVCLVAALRTKSCTLGSERRDGTANYREILSSQLRPIRSRRFDVGCGKSQEKLGVQARVSPNVFFFLWRISHEAIVGFLGCIGRKREEGRAPVAGSALSGIVRSWDRQEDTTRLAAVVKQATRGATCDGDLDR